MHIHKVSLILMEGRILYAETGVHKARISVWRDVATAHPSCRVISHTLFTGVHRINIEIFFSFYRTY